MAPENGFIAFKYDVPCSGLGFEADCIISIVIYEEPCHKNNCKVCLCADKLFETHASNNATKLRVCTR